MNGQFEQQDFADTLLAGTGKIPLSITCSAFLDEQAVLPNGQIKPCWSVSFLLTGSGFSISKVLQIGTSKSCEKEANRISDLINEWQDGYKTLKEALKLCIPDSLEGSQLEDWQKDTINQARKIIEKED